MNTRVDEAATEALRSKMDGLMEKYVKALRSGGQMGEIANSLISMVVKRTPKQARRLLLAALKREVKDAGDEGSDDNGASDESITEQVNKFRACGMNYVLIAPDGEESFVETLEEAKETIGEAVGVKIVPIAQYVKSAVAEAKKKGDDEPDPDADDEGDGEGDDDEGDDDTGDEPNGDDTEDESLREANGNGKKNGKGLQKPELDNGDGEPKDADDAGKVGIDDPDADDDFVGDWGSDEAIIVFTFPKDRVQEFVDLSQKAGADGNSHVVMEGDAVRVALPKAVGEKVRALFTGEDVKVVVREAKVVTQ
jgi:hypothetical protein